MTPDLDFARCLACGEPGLTGAEAGIACARCGERYAVEAGVPLLVREWAAHRAEIEAAAQVNPRWYVDEQPQAAASPWRHHLKKRRRFVESAIRAHLGRAGLARAPRLLDLGCGDGTNLTWLAKFAERIYGSDYNLLRLARARALAPEASLFLADVLDHAGRDGYFDVVFFNHVIEHIPDDLRALGSVLRILKPGGLLVLGTPNEGCWWWQLAYRRAPEVLASTDHVHFYTGLTIAAKVRKVGLEVTRVKHLGWGPPDWYLDGRLRGHKLLDDLFEWVGRVVLPHQASSLYVIARKPQESARV